MTTQADINDFLAQKRFAFVGVSRQARDFSREVFREFRKKGYEPVPVHPDTNEIEGTHCYARVEDIQPPVDSVLLMTSPEVTGTIARQCVAAGVKRIWFYRGAGTRNLNEEAIGACRQGGLQVIPGECPLMFLPQTGVVHRFHGLVKKILGTYPA